ncbi:MAG: hypothetical protein WBO35_03245, partial [Candidatus Saccharimonadales bacterium]
CQRALSTTRPVELAGRATDVRGLTETLRRRAALPVVARSDALVPSTGDESMKAWTMLDVR